MIQGNVKYEAKYSTFSAHTVFTSEVPKILKLSANCVFM